jgi:hypothetical protein
MIRLSPSVKWRCALSGGRSGRPCTPPALVCPTMGRGCRDQAGRVTSRVNFQLRLCLADALKVPLLVRHLLGRLIAPALAGHAVRSPLFPLPRLASAMRSLARRAWAPRSHSLTAHRFVATGVGLQFSAVYCHVSKLHQPCPQAQCPDEKCRERSEIALAKVANGTEVRLVRSPVTAIKSIRSLQARANW